MSVIVDGRDYDSDNINRVVFDTFDSLDLGEKMELVDDHDPKSVYNELLKEHEGLFEWDYIKEGPDLWKVCIGKKYLSYI